MGNDNEWDRLGIKLDSNNNNNKDGKEVYGCKRKLKILYEEDIRFFFNSRLCIELVVRKRINNDKMELTFEPFYVDVLFSLSELFFFFKLPPCRSIKISDFMTDS